MTECELYYSNKQTNKKEELNATLYFDVFGTYKLMTTKIKSIKNQSKPEKRKQQEINKKLKSGKYHCS